MKRAIIESTNSRASSTRSESGPPSCADVIVVSDHGMSDISCERSVLLNDHLAPGTLYDVYAYPGPAGRIANDYIYGGDDNEHVPPEDRVPYSELIANLTCVDPNMSVFNKKDLPRRHHYVVSDRIDDAIMVMNDRWTVDRYDPWCAIIGNHGWDPAFPNLRAYFSAYGPSFKHEFESPAFENIEVYNLLALLTNVSAALNNGTEGSLYHLLKRAPSVQASVADDSYVTCVYPGDEAYETRANTTTCTCDDIEDVAAADERLNVSLTERQVLDATHLPHGVPRGTEGHVCRLHHDDYVSAYSSNIYMPLYTAFNLSAAQLGEREVPDCMRPDVRVNSSDLPDCLNYLNSTGLEYSHLFPAEFCSSDETVPDALVTSNIVPMFNNFKSVIWRDMLDLLREWTASYDSLLTLAGPIFDYDADGIQDSSHSLFVGDSAVPVPSHYFVIALRCDVDNCDDMTYTTQAFVIPHQPNITNCMTSTTYLQDNVARIRDIELLTGLQFLTAAASDADRQMAIQKRTFTQDTWW